MCRLKHFIVSIVVSSILACIPLYIAVKHNSMGEFCTAKSLALSTCRYDFNYIFMVWGSWQGKITKPLALQGLAKGSCCYGSLFS
ncbi:hypothetical protein, partial [Vibrio sp. 1401]|uniref:hypothetical protein n=1 Tax=Vibrio sp. 1401 TaxID=3074553 RepID=UPI002964FC88